MPSWAIAQIGITVFWIIAAVVFYRLYFWTVSYPLTPKDGLKITFGMFAPVLWALSEIVYFFFLRSKIGTISPSQIITPSISTIALIVILLRIVVMNLVHRKEDELDSEIVESALSECQEWAKKFPFLTDEKVKFQLYAVKGHAVGKVTVKCYSVEECLALERNRDSLPQGVNLWLNKLKNEKK